MSKKQSINIETIGLQSYLDSTKDRHNGEGYDRFVFYLQPKIKLGFSTIGRIMNVNRLTISRWADIYRKEQDNG